MNRNEGARGSDATQKTLTGGRAGTPRWAALLMHRTVEQATRRTLRNAGWPREELDDGVQEVRLDVVGAVRRGAVVPDDLDEMAAYCTTIARRASIDRGRHEAVVARVCDGPCGRPDKTGAKAQMLAHAARTVGRDPIDARRQLTIAADLFREGRMPARGVAILEGVASGCSTPEIAEEEGLSRDAVKGRLRTMRRTYRARLEDERLTGGPSVGERKRARR